MAALNIELPIRLQGHHVRLEPLGEEHVAGLAAIGLDETIWRYMPYGPMLNADDIQRWVQGVLQLGAKGTDIPFAVIHTESGRVAGATRFMEIRREHRGVEIGGTWYGAAYRRTAVNTESKFLLLQYAFDVLGCIRVQFKTDKHNERSQKAIERLGAVREGVLRNHMVLPDGNLRDSVYYSILDVEWRTVKRRLLEFLLR